MARPAPPQCAPDADAGPALVAAPEECGACTYSQRPDPMAGALLALWEHRKLCDVALAPADGAALPAHRLVLAAASGFFRALFTVRRGRRRQRGARGGGAKAGSGCAAARAAKPATHRVRRALAERGPQLSGASRALPHFKPTGRGRGDA
jgi:hypothetical protein